MRVLNWCMLGAAVLLLVCQVIIHQLCESLIVLVDGFHTLFMLVRMAFPPSKPVSVRKPPLSPAYSPPSSAAPPSLLSVDSAIKVLPPDTHTSTDESQIQEQPPIPQPPLEAAAQVNSPEVSPALNCGLSYSSSRTQVVGAFISALVLTSLCLSCVTEIISFSLDPHPVQHPPLPVLVGAISLLYKMLLLWLKWDQMKQEQAGAGRQLETKSHFEVNHKVSTKGKAEGWIDPEKLLDDVSQVQYPADDPLHNGALVLSNPGISTSSPDRDSENPQPQPGVHLHAAAPRDSGDCEGLSCVADLSQTEEITGISKDRTCKGHLGNENASNSSQICKSSHPTDSPVPTSQEVVILLPSTLVVQSLCTPILSLINSLVTLLVGPQCLHSSGACGLLVYLDPVLSMLAVCVLIAMAMPEVHRYGLLLLQSTPPHICVSDLGRRIASVPGVQAVHDLHVWQLAGTLTVASVHVHCHAGFPLHRCVDVLSGVTKVLQSVGVSCCTVQPEFVSYSGSSAGSEGETSPVIHREDPTLPPLQLTCSLACGKACAGFMCCSPKEEPTRTLLTPAGETKEDPQTLVIENTFL
ncbi:proton-coupled zinc antiporter SLC30A1 [Labrus bergylta]|uniref:proton-coupled zinc antiporter SLC30A1 n=1 Tax=Labrus bergylta TaxID=56723 RepID=UPI0033131C8C